MGRSTISTGPFSIANCKRLPEGNPPFSSGISKATADYVFARAGSSPDELRGFHHGERLKPHKLGYGASITLINYD